MTNPTIETDLAEILKEMRLEHKASMQEITQRLNSIDGRLNNLEVGQARLEEKFKAQDKILTGLNSTQKNQIWSLIALIFTAILGLLVGLGKFIFFPNP